MTLAEQLTDIYYKEEYWHKSRLSFADALEYHKKRLENGDIYTYEENGEVLGYYERYFKDDICFLYNVWVNQEYRKGKVFKELYKHFFETMPKHIKYIEGEKQKLGGKLMKEKIHGLDKN